MNIKKSAIVFLSLSILSTCMGIGVVAYNWGYMQCDIDNLITATSAPAYITVFTGIPFIIVTLVSIIIAIVISKKK